MKMQLSNFAGCLIAAGLLATGFSAPLEKNDVEGVVDHTHARSIGDSLPISLQADPVAVRALGGSKHAHAVDTVEVEAAPFDKRAKKPVKAPAKAPGRAPAKTPVRGPAKTPAKTPTRGPAKTPVRDGQTPAKTPATPKVQFTKYPKKKQSWKPPTKAKKPVVKRSEPITAIREAEGHSLHKRQQHIVEAGTMERGAAADTMKTWHVINCISITAYDSATEQKVMVHMNAINTRGQEYSAQFTNFANVVYSFQGPVEVTVRWPHSTAIPSTMSAGTRQAQELFERDVRGWLAVMATSATPRVSIDQRNAKKRQGDMVQAADGSVTIDEL